VDTASTAELALEMVSGAPPDAILSDIQMPGMDGFALRQAIRQDARLSTIPIVLMSSALAEEQQRRGKPAEDLCVVRTPDLREAIDAITSALDASHA
jgi:two-component system chemotaxis sensor kinase CheA